MKKIDAVYIDGTAYDSPAAVVEANPEISLGYLYNLLRRHKPGEEFAIKGHRAYYTLALKEKPVKHAELLGDDEPVEPPSTIAPWADADRAIYEEFLKKFGVIEATNTALIRRLASMERVIKKLRIALGGEA